MTPDGADRAALMQLAMDYIDAVNTRDASRWAACWAPGARWIIRDQPIDGVDAIVERWTTAMAGFDRVVQLFGGITVDHPDPDDEPTEPADSAGSSTTGTAAATATDPGSGDSPWGVGRTVTARVHFYEGLWRPDEVDPTHNHFTYLDRCVLTPTGWRYAERRLTPAGQPPR